MSIVLCIVGMCGAGKSAATDYVMQKRHFEYLRFGQLTLDKIIELGVPPTEALEKQIREQLREDHGMAAFATLNIPKIEELIKKGDVIVDGLYSWEEYLVLKEQYGEKLHVVAIYAPPSLRYQRLENRSALHKDDKDLRYRSFSKESAISRDKAEIENSHKAGPIVMAEYTIVNTGSLDELYSQLDIVLKALPKS